MMVGEPAGELQVREAHGLVCLCLVQETLLAAVVAVLHILGQRDRS